MEKPHIGRVRAADLIFLQQISATAIVLGTFFLILGLSCKIVDWGYCGLDLFPVLGGDNRFSGDITAINLPMALMVLGAGIRLRSVYGWWVVTALLMLLLVFFGFFLAFHEQYWPMQETGPGIWEKANITSFQRADAFATCLVALLLVLLGFFYWISHQVRIAYFYPSDNVLSRSSNITSEQ